MLATPPIPPQNPPNFDAPKVSAAARVLITKRALMFKSDTPEGVVEEYIRQTGCKFEP